MRRMISVGAALVLCGAVVPLTSPEGAGVAVAAQGAAIPFDFDGDGYADLAVGVPGEDLRGKLNAGAVQVLYGSASGPTAHDQLWHQGRKGVKGAVEAGDFFGSALTSGDFDHDGFADLAIGIPRENIGRGSRRKPNAGTVQVLYGSASGLTAARDQVWHQGSTGVPGVNESHDNFGDALAAGDFDGDGYADLAIGSARENTRAGRNTGRVVVLRGSAGGLRAGGVQSWNEGSAGIASQPLRDEDFGETLEAGDVTGDGFDDLLIGVRDMADGEWRGAVHLLLGSDTGLTSAGSQFIGLTDLGIGLTSQYTLIHSLSLGDVNADGREDLALNADNRDTVLLHGHADGFRPGPLVSPGQPGKDTIWRESYGAALSGDLTGDGYVDLALNHEPMIIQIGTPVGLGPSIAQWSLPADQRAASLLPLSGASPQWLVFAGGDYGSQAGYVAARQGTPTGEPGSGGVWDQDSPGIKGTAEPGDHFGRSVG